MKMRRTSSGLHNLDKDKFMWTTIKSVRFRSRQKESIWTLAHMLRLKIELYNGNTAKKDLFFLNIVIK